MNEKTKKLWKIVFLVITNFALLVIVLSANAQAARMGSHGERIAEIQKALFDLNFYSGEINGSFDFSTRQAVKRFQRQNNLEATGETDFETLALLGIDSHSENFCILTELLARYIRSQGNTSYGSMLTAASDTLKNKNSLSLIRYILINDPDFMKSLSTDEPSSEAYSAASAAIKRDYPIKG